MGLWDWYWCICCPEDLVDVNLLQRVENSVNELSAPLSAVVMAAVVHCTGEVVVLRADKGVNAQRALSVVPALKRAAALHCASMPVRPREIASITAKGSRTLVSVWEHSGTVAMVVSEEAAPDAADTAGLDGRVAPIMARLHAEVDHLMRAVGGRDAQQRQ